MNGNNGELVGAYGNFINRTLAFIEKYQGGVIPESGLDDELSKRTDELYATIGQKIEKGFLKDALEEIFEFVRFDNKYYDAEKPWVTRNTDEIKCHNTLYNCVQMIANLAVLLAPFLPFSSDKIFGWLGVKNIWHKQTVEAGYRLPHTEILFGRIKKETVDEEMSRLQKIGEVI